MAFSINLLCLSGFIDADHLDTLRHLKDLGYDGVEIPILTGDTQHYDWLGKQLDQIGLRRTSTSVVPSPEANPLSADAQVRAQGLAHLNWVSDCAEALGSESIGGPIHAPIGHFTGSGPSPDELKYGAVAHHALAERASRAGAIISLEPLNRFETHFLNTMAQARDYVDMVDHPAFKIMYDTFHAHIEEKDQVAAIKTVSPKIGVLHVSENDRGIPGSGQIDFTSIFAAVKKSGFDGWVITEAFGAGLPELAAATRVWRPLVKDHDTLFEQSLNFMRKTWATS